MTFDIKGILENIKSKQIDSKAHYVMILPDNSGKLTHDEMNNLLRALQKNESEIVDSQSHYVMVPPDNSGKLTLNDINNFVNALQK